MNDHKKRMHTETKTTVGEEEEIVPAATEESFNCIIDDEDRTYTLWIKQENINEFYT